MRQLVIIIALTIVVPGQALAGNFKGSFTTRVNEVAGLTITPPPGSKRSLRVRRRGTTLNIHWRGPRGKRFFFSLKQIQPGVFFSESNTATADASGCSSSTSAAWKDLSNRKATFIRRAIKTCADGRLQDLTTTGAIRRVRR